MRLSRLTERKSDAMNGDVMPTVPQIKEGIGRLVYIGRNASSLAYSSFGVPCH
jgi:hypothetical protein